MQTRCVNTTDSVAYESRQFVKLIEVSFSAEPATKVAAARKNVQNHMPTYTPMLVV